MSSESTFAKPAHNIRVITATALFDGHDVSINIIRRMLQAAGVEVIHLAHNRSVHELVNTAICEDVQGIALSSYQGGHLETFKYLVDHLRENDAVHIKVFGGGGGVIVADEIRQLEEYGVEKIFTPQDGSDMGLRGMIDHMIKVLDYSTLGFHKLNPKLLSTQHPKIIGGIITAVQQAKAESQDKLHSLLKKIEPLALKHASPVIGITGTGGSGKSSLTDELIVRFGHYLKDTRIAVVSCDPSRRKTGGALLGDRIRMNSLSQSQNVYMRSLATRDTSTEIPEALPEVVQVLKAAGFDVIIVETAGIGQGDSRIIDIADLSIYVMTSEYGAPSQLEKIDMLDYADLIVINKFDKNGSEDALRDIRKQVRRNRDLWDHSPEDLPVYGTIASKFNDDGVSALFHGLIQELSLTTTFSPSTKLPQTDNKVSSSRSILIPPERIRYLSEISGAIRSYHSKTKKQKEFIKKHTYLTGALACLNDKNDKEAIKARGLLQDEAASINRLLDNETVALLEQWAELRENFSGEEYRYRVRGKDVTVPLYFDSLSQIRIPRVSLPKFTDPADIYSWMRKENIPGYFPYTGGVFPFKRTQEDPTRMFAGEGGPAQTNARFKLLSENYSAKRLSTAFDSVTLYGCDPESRLDIYGKIGTSGVSVCTLDDIKLLYDGFDLCSPLTSVSMTINGPAPIILAMYMNVAIDQQREQFINNNQRPPTKQEEKELSNQVFNNIRGTVQADILKEDQGQNTCIFSIDFALKMMGDIQEYFIQNSVQNFYSVSVSGYHIAEAGANPISQLAFTLANGFTYVEYYLSRGMTIDQIAPNLSFFFSNGMEPEYTVIGRVARRIWAVAIKEKYGGSATSQRLKYHIQTSGRSLHSRDIQFNDIRTTLQALCGIYDNCNSLHTNAYDEAITTPSTESVRRALAIQLIINREWGLAKTENINQGSFVVEELTDLVEEAVLAEFDRITERGGVLGAMETGYQRSKIQEESIYYESLKHSGEYPIVGVNTFLNPELDPDQETTHLKLVRATEEDKNEQIARLQHFHESHQDKAKGALNRLKEVALNGENIFEELLTTVRSCSLGQITNALFEVGGKYRRNM